MTVLFYAALFALLGLLAAVLFANASAPALARGVRVAGPLALSLLGLGLMLAGRVSLGAMLMAAAFSWWGAGRIAARGRPSAGRKSTVRTAALEMELDHDSGSMEGIVLAGPYEGCMLSGLKPVELLELHQSLVADPESLQLLEAYLDSRLAGWRDDVEADIGAGEGAAPGPGRMTEEEAYNILGLEPGASASDIRKAHRRLMQRVHPDLGGSSFLAARINEARDFLLKHHH